MERFVRTVAGESHPHKRFSTGRVTRETGRSPEQVAVVAELLRAGAAGDEHFLEAMETIIPLYFHDYEAGLFERLLGRTRFRAAAQNHGSSACLSDFRLVVFEGSGHFPFVEETEAFLEAVREWEAT